MVLALFWFAGSTAWAVGLHSLKDKTDADKYTKTASECRDSGATCDVLKEASYVGLTISVVGTSIANRRVWSGNVLLCLVLVLLRITVAAAVDILKTSSKPGNRNV